jgi:hypothetical protein
MLWVMGTKLKLANSNEEFARGEHKPLDASIHDAVLIMRGAGIEPFESHEGEPGQAFDMPTIKFRGNALAGYKALMDNGFAVWSVKHVWEVANGQLEGPWWEIVLHSTGKLLPTFLELP